MEILSKNRIKTCIIQHLSRGSRGKRLSSSYLEKVVGLVLYRLKTGCQWRMLPICCYFSGQGVRWETIYHHFKKWVKDGSWFRVWKNLLQQYRHSLDLSCVQLDGSHTPSKRGGESVGYQGRKSCKTTNTLYLCDNQGQMLACACPQSGEHNDLFAIRPLFDELCGVLTEAGFRLDGLFLNADAGFDSEEFRQLGSEKDIEINVPTNPRNQKQEDHQNYFDELLYQRRTCIERANAWQDSFKLLLVRFETKVLHWKNWIVIGFIISFIQKLIRAKKL